MTLPTPTLSTTTTRAEILNWLNTQLDLHFSGKYKPVQAFSWVKETTRKRSFWAGSYCRAHITLNPQFFVGITNSTLQSQALEDVLLHELCHHIVDRLDPHAPSHGREFRELAYYLNGRLGREAVTIYHELQKTPEGQEAARAQRKALALLARTTSSNEHEALIASAKYSALVAQYNLTLDHHTATLASGLPETVKEHIWTAKCASTWLLTLLRAVAYTHGCVFTYIRKSNGYTQFHFYGRAIKISQAYDLIDYLTAAIERVVKQAKADAKKQSSTEKEFIREFNFVLGVRKPAAEPSGRSYWMAFREGISKRVAQAIYDDHNRRMSEGLTTPNGINHIPGLVLQSSFAKEQQAAEEYLKDLHPHTRSSGSRTGSCSHAGRSAGYSAGKSISTARQTTGSAPRSLAAAR